MFTPNGSGCRYLFDFQGVRPFNRSFMAWSWHEVLDGINRTQLTTLSLRVRAVSVVAYSHILMWLYATWDVMRSQMNINNFN